VLIQELTLDLLATFVVTIYDLEETSFVMGVKIFVDDDSITLLMRTVYSSEVACKLMGFHFFPFQSD
jgi:hypothetical protein